MYTIYFMLYLIEILHQTTTPFEGFCPLSELYLIEILHQTTTSGLTRQIKRCCILSKFYIKPQLQMYTIYFTFRCILSKFYIKPQLVLEALLLPPCCILSKFYIKPQLMMTTREGSMRCILSKFYIKPQRVHTSFENGLVVSYRNSTSNHNVETPDMETPSVVSYRNSTSNHNVYGRFVSRLLLYLIEILHQTTTKVFFIYLWCKNSTSYHNKAICRRFSTYCLRVLRGDFFYIS